MLVASLPLNAVDLLYGLCSALLLGSAAFVWTKEPRSSVNRAFALTAFALLVWLVTLALFHRSDDPAAVLWLGRVNFAAVVFAVYLGYVFVAAVARKDLPQPFLLLGGTVLLALLSAFTPLVDRAELTGAGSAGRHITVYGPLFPLYLVHVAAYLTVAVTLAFRTRRSAPRPQRDQLALIGAGTMATGMVALITNALLPYGFGDFRFVDVGTLSTILFLLAVAWAVVRHRLFDVRLFIRKTLLWGLLLSFVLAAYGAVLVLVTEYLVGDSASTLTRFGVLVIASSFDPLRRFLEKRIDELLFRKGKLIGHRR